MLCIIYVLGNIFQATHMKCRKRTIEVCNMAHAYGICSCTCVYIIHNLYAYILSFIRYIVLLNLFFQVK